ncbi:MAG: hypothetical protein ACRCZ9_00740 [Fusobacteriaceae bacterium]
MKGIEHLFQIEIDEKIYIRNDKNKITIKIRSELFDKKTIVNLFKKISMIKEQYNDEKITLILKLGNITFKDKSVYILLESMIYSVCKENKFKLKIIIKNMRLSNIYYSHIKFSLLNKYKNSIIKKEDFIKDFLKIELSRFKYRKVVNSNNSLNLSKLLTELNSFFKLYNIDESFKEQLAEMLVELAGNANEHSESDCLVDLTIDNAVNKIDMHKCIAVDIVVLNFSKILLGHGIKENFKQSNKFSIRNRPIDKNRFIIDLKTAYENHKNKFSDEYTEEDFFNISTFQWRFSGRKDIVQENGGTGLTKVIEFLLDVSEANDCYVYSGTRAIVFHKDLIGVKSKSNPYVGFNKELDYLNGVPDSSVIGKSLFHLNGTLYNLKFILPRLGGK